VAAKRLRAFDFEPGVCLGDRYDVIERLGGGWEGEVYKVVERGTRIERAAKLFYPQRNAGDRAVRYYARKLHKLRECGILIHYHGAEPVQVGGARITMLVSDFVEGELLSVFLKRFPGGRLRPFEGLHLLHALARGVEEIHLRGEYHGDIHSDNIIVARFGLQFELKLIDLYRLDDSPAAARRLDVCDLIYVFWEAIGGAPRYARHPAAVKYICCGLKRTLIRAKFPTVGHLRQHLEELSF
jgi:tRNA A-37 threonylcarbamoyl transferase component Bud32